MSYNENIGTSVRIQARDKLGRFYKRMDGAAEASARDLVDRGVELAKANAKHFRKTGRLEEGIVADYHGKVGYVRSTAPHAHPVEKGSVAHVENNAFGKGKGVMHPGNKAQPYLDQVPAQLAREAEGVIRRNYHVDQAAGGQPLGGSDFGYDSGQFDDFFGDEHPF